MKAKPLFSVLILFALLGNSVAALAHLDPQSLQDWGAVRALAAGEKIAVQLKDGKKLDGRLRGATDRTITLERNNGSIDLNREAIAKVYQVVKKSRGKSSLKGAAIGAGIGFGAGAGVGLAAGGYEDLSQGEVVGILGLLGAGIGAGIGAVIGAIGSKEKKILIYQA